MMCEWNMIKRLDEIISEGDAPFQYDFGYYL